MRFSLEFFGIYASGGYKLIFRSYIIGSEDLFATFRFLHKHSLYSILIPCILFLPTTMELEALFSSPDVLTGSLHIYTEWRMQLSFSISCLI